MKKILVTGGAGFVGSALVRLAVKRGYYVINLDCLTYASCLKSVAEVENSSSYKFELGDIRQRKTIDHVLSKYKPEAVIHLAAESHVDRSIVNPQIFMETNFMGTFNMLEASRCYWENEGWPKDFRFHYVSTDEVFGSLQSDKSLKFSETTRYNPSSPYSSSKASSNHLVNAWHHTYQLPTILTNASNNYGPYQFPEKLIPVIIMSAIAEKSLPIYGDGTQVRDWIHVNDHADAILRAVNLGQPGRSYNIGGDNEMTNLQLVRDICQVLQEVRPKMSGSYLDLIEFKADRPGHDARYGIDTKRIRHELDWYPSTNFKKGLQHTVVWYLENEEWCKPHLNNS